MFFDKDRNGIVLGEGAGFLILETLDSALARQAKILCEIQGFGMSGDGYHLVKPQESGEGNLRAMLMAVDRSGLKPKEIIEEGLFVNAHATSTVVGDKAELIGIEKLINHLSQKQVDKVRAISFKANIGHCFSAAGIIESILGIHSLNTETIPKNLFFDGCEVEQNTVKFSKTQTTFKGRYMLKNSFGFGGVNTSMLISK